MSCETTNCNHLDKYDFGKSFEQVPVKSYVSQEFLIIVDACAQYQ